MTAKTRNAPNNFVLSETDRKIYYYTPETLEKYNNGELGSVKTYEGTFPLEDFYNRKEGEHEKKK